MDIRVRRALAFGIDLLLVAAGTAATHPLALSVVSDIRVWPLASIPSILVMGSFAATGSTPGKRLFGLSITSAIGKPSFGKAITRELLRFLSLPVFVLPILYAVDWLTTGTTPYDRFLHLEVRPNASKDAPAA